MGTTWEPWGCGDHMGTMWGQHGDHGDVETMWGQHEDNMGTTLLRYRSKILFSRIELFLSNVLSSRVTNYKNDIHKFS